MKSTWNIWPNTIIFLLFVSGKLCIYAYQIISVYCKRGILRPQVGIGEYLPHLVLFGCSRISVAKSYNNVLWYKVYLLRT